MKFNFNVGDSVYVLTEREEYTKGEIVNINDQVITLKHFVSKDSLYNRGPWVGGELTDILSHIKIDNIKEIWRYDTR